MSLHLHGQARICILRLMPGVLYAVVTVTQSEEANLLVPKLQGSCHGHACEVDLAAALSVPNLKSASMGAGERCTTKEPWCMFPGDSIMNIHNIHCYKAACICSREPRQSFQACKLTQWPFSYSKNTALPVH